MFCWLTNYLDLFYHQLSDNDQTSKFSPIQKWPLYTHQGSLYIICSFLCCLLFMVMIMDYRRLEEIAFTAWPKIQSQSQIFKCSWSIFCLPHQPNFSDIFLFLHWVSVVLGYDTVAKGIFWIGLTFLVK